MTDPDFQTFEIQQYRTFVELARYSYRGNWLWDMALGALSIAATTGTAVLVSIPEMKTNHAYVLAGIAWLGAFSAGLASNFTIRARKEKWEKLWAALLVERANFDANIEPYKTSKEPRRLFAARVAALYAATS